MMQDTLRNAQHVLKTSGANIEIMSFNAKNERIGTFTYKSRPAAIKALVRMTGRVVTLRPMQTPDNWKVETHQELSDIPSADE